ncbi:hypothetical protein [Bartonella tribocorum]|uniref:Uncharacterized protein n=1 Tax=Bartonella tribocorum TaxID=85701 RepID=A0A2M6UQT1_9HYPH|nr:hypothetical protein [Bartonella tribocorum]PIT68531.1 hypothetical protein CER18_06400 [Bartonella tribocorum]
MKIQSSGTLWTSTTKTEMHILLGGGSFDNESENGRFGRATLMVNETNEQTSVRGCSRPRHF